MDHQQSGQWDAGQPSRKISFKKALKKALLQQRPDLQFLEKDIQQAMNRGLIADSFLVLLHNGRMDLIDPVPPPEHIKEFLRSADRGTIQGIILEALFCEFEKLDEE